MLILMYCMGDREILNVKSYLQSSLCELLIKSEIINYSYSKWVNKC
jgi:hypothetical protein